MTIINNAHWVTTVHGRSGYGTVSRGIMTEMLKQKIPFTYEDYDWDNGMKQQREDYPYQELKKLEKMQRHFLISNADNIIHHRTVTTADTLILPKELRTKKNIFLTGYPFEPHPPPYFSSALSQYDKIVTPSEYSKKILSTHHISPLVAPWGYDPSIFYPSDDEQFDYKYGDKRYKRPFTFLSVFQWQDLKSPYELINAYLQEFNKEDNTRLLLRVHMDGSSQSILNILQIIKKWSKRITDFTGKTNMPYIELLVNNLGNKAMAHLYQNSNVFIHPSKAEFFGLPVLEAMQCATPVIASRWHAVGEFYPKTKLSLESYKVTPMPQEYTGTIYDDKFGIHQKSPYIMDIREKMRLAYEMDTKEVLDIINKQLEMSQHLTWENTVNMLKEIKI